MRQLPTNATLGLRTGQYVNRRGVVVRGNRGIPQALVIDKLPEIAAQHGQILAAQVAAEQAGVTPIQVPYEASYRKPLSILKTAKTAPAPPLQMEEFEAKYADTPVTGTASSIPAALSRINMNANRDPNAAYARFNRNVRPFLRGEQGSTIKARRRGLFTGESKNSYRRTLKVQLKQLMKNIGSAVGPMEALRHIEALTRDVSVPAPVIYERMREWIAQFAPPRNLSTVGAVLPLDPKLEAVANAFLSLTPTSSRADLQRAATNALSVAVTSGALPVYVTPFLDKLLELKERSTTLSAAEYYMAFTQLLRENPDVVVAAAIKTPVPPAKRGFFSRLTSASSNTKEWSAINASLLDAIEAIQRLEPPVTASTKSEAPIPVAPILPVTPAPAVTVTTQNYRIPIGQPGGGASYTPEYQYWRVLREGGHVTAANPVPQSNTDERTVKNLSATDLQTMIGHLGGGRKTRHHSRMNRRRRTRKQRGGAATSMPLAWYQQGAQFQGTLADPTGVGLAGSSAAWARSALPAQGGGSRRQRGQRLGVADQQGGFTPSVMGAGFAEVGMRLLPAAAYMGYNQFQNYKKRRTHRRRRSIR